MTGRAELTVLHFSAADVEGGAARAASRLHLALRDAGVASSMIVGARRSTLPGIERAPDITGARRLVRRSRRRLGRGFAHPVYTFNLDLPPLVDTSFFFARPSGAVDIVGLHWVTDFVSVREIAALHAHYSAPIVWTVVDQAPVTGGCHYSFGCERFQHRCGRCPQLRSHNPYDLSRRLWRRKERRLGGLPLTLVAPTSQVERWIRESSLFGRHRVERIPLSIDDAVYRPGERGAARAALDIPDTAAVLFAGASHVDDRRKGMPYLLDALKALRARVDVGGTRLAARDVLVLVAGAESGRLVAEIPFAARALGPIDDDVSLALAYQAADAFVCPSVEDAGPMMIPEAMMCGTPVVAFEMGGAPDLVTGRTGHLARLRDVQDLAGGMLRVLEAEDAAAMREACSDAAARAHAPGVVARRYVELYDSLRPA